MSDKHTLPEQTMITVDVDAFVGLCTANAELGTALVEALTKQDERYERKSAELEAHKADPELNKYKGVCEGQAERIRDLVSESNELQMELNRARIRESNMNERHAETLALKARAEKMLTEKNAQFEALEKKNAQLQGQCSSRADRIMEAAEREREHERLAGDLSRKIASLTEQLTELRADSDQLEKEQQSRYQELNRANEALLAQVKAMRNQDVIVLIRDGLQALRDEVNEQLSPSQDRAKCLILIDTFAGKVARFAK